MEPTECYYSFGGVREPSGGINLPLWSTRRDPWSRTPTPCWSCCRHSPIEPAWSHSTGGPWKHIWATATLESPFVGYTCIGPCNLEWSISTSTSCTTYIRTGDDTSWCNYIGPYQPTTCPDPREHDDTSRQPVQWSYPIAPTCTGPAAGLAPCIPWLYDGQSFLVDV